MVLYVHLIYLSIYITSGINAIKILVSSSADPKKFLSTRYESNFEIISWKQIEALFRLFIRNAADIISKKYRVANLKMLSIDYLKNVWFSTFQSVSLSFILQFVIQKVSRDTFEIEFSKSRRAPMPVRVDRLSATEFQLARRYSPWR